jgi:hypothetical protein
MVTARPRRNAATQPRDARGRFQRAPGSSGVDGPSAQLLLGRPDSKSDKNKNTNKTANKNTNKTTNKKTSARVGRMRVDTSPATTAQPTPKPPPRTETVREPRRKGPAHEGWGPFYDLAGAARVLHRSAGEVEQRGATGGLLMVVTVEGDRLFPAWQFDGAKVHSGVSRVLGEFQGVPVDPWLIVQWATAPDPRLGGVSAVQWLHDHGDGEVEPVLLDARDYAWRWSQ